MFAYLADEDEAKFLLAASPPATVEEISLKSGLPLNKIQAMVDPLFKKGLIFISRTRCHPLYKVRYFIQFTDATVLTPGVDQGYLDLWK
jgi:hypothetical protein